MSTLKIINKSVDSKDSKESKITSPRIKLKVNTSQNAQNVTQSNIQTPSSSIQNGIQNNQIQNNQNGVTLSIKTPTSSSIQNGNHTTPTTNTNLVPTTNIQKRVETSAPDASHYKHYSEQRKHIYDIPDTYIGSTEQNQREAFVLDLSQRKVLKTLISFPEGAERLFLEIISNAGDNSEKSRLCNVDPGKIEIKMDKQTVQIRNGGVPIPVEKHQETGLWVPHMIFGVLLTSSNYDKNVVRLGCGRNGYGAKLVSVFSKFFMIEVGDNVRKRKYVQIWRDNMGIVGEPVITEGYTGENYVEITYQMDFQRFGYTEYPDEAFHLFAGYSADFSWTCKVPIIFNGADLSVMNIKDYAKLYYSDEVNMIIHYEYPETKQITNKKGEVITVAVEFIEKKGVRTPKDPSVIPISELCLIDTPDCASQISFVNGMRTMLGGVHVESAVKSVSNIILAFFNESDSGKKGKNKDEKKVKLTPGDLKQHMSILLSCRLPDPKFKSQTKENLASPTPKFNINEKEVKSMERWKLFDRLYAALEAKEFKNLAKTDGKKKKHIDNPKLQDANWAGSKDSINAVLILTEGDSAAAYAKTLIGLLAEGRDKYGVFPLKGKGLNVMTATASEIANNVEIVNLKQIIGLREGVDYTNDVNYKTLRYGKILILSDEDKDALHIRGLTMNFFYCRYPSLIHRQCLWYLRTPIIRVWKGKQTKKFYTETSYHTWKNSTPNYDSWNHKYFKGLGTSTKENIRDEKDDLRYVTCIYDDKTPESMNLAFHQKLADARKKWLAEFSQIVEFEHVKMQPISDFINYEFVHFGLVNLHRSIPRMMDGLKISQRKILWACYLIWKFNSNGKELKVAQFSASVAEKTKYHYGENALNEAIIGMAQDIVGLNNLPYLQPIGGYGLRDRLGKDASAPRYIFTKPCWWLMYVFKKEDIPILKLVVDEGEECEPISFLPIIPTVLINGERGIGTGHSTFVPSYNPLDIILWLKSKIKGLELPNLIPWYKGFKGLIQIVTAGQKKNIKIGNLNDEKEKSDNDDEDINELKLNEPLEEKKINNEEEDFNETLDDVKEETANEEKMERIARNSKYTMVTYGNLAMGPNEIVVITELPVQKSTHSYRNYLKLLLQEGKISDFKDYCNDDQDLIHFEVFGIKNPTHEKLKLIKSFGMSNMVLLDLNNKPHKYEDVNEILETFYRERLPYFEIRRQNILQELNVEMLKYQHKMKLFQAILDGTLVVLNRPKSEIHQKLKNMNVPVEIYSNAKLTNISMDEIKEFQQEIDDCNKKIMYYNSVNGSDLWMIDLDEFEKEYKKRDGKI